MSKNYSPSSTNSIQPTKSRDDIADAQTPDRLPVSIVRSLVNNNVRPLRSRNSKGHWSGERGNSYFILDDDAEFPISPHSDVMITGAELKKRYGFDGILYRGFEPVFLPFRDRLIDAIKIDNMPLERGKKGGSYDLASQNVVERGIMPNKSDVKEYMKQHNLVWHECGDCRTIIAIPWHINAIFSHTGAIGIMNQMNELSAEVHKYRKLVLNKQGLTKGDGTIRIRKIYRKIR